MIMSKRWLIARIGLQSDPPFVSDSYLPQPHCWILRLDYQCCWTNSLWDLLWQWFWLFSWHYLFVSSMKQLLSYLSFCSYFLLQISFHLHCFRIRVSRIVGLFFLPFVTVGFFKCWEADFYVRLCKAFQESVVVKSFHNILFYTASSCRFIVYTYYILFPAQNFFVCFLLTLFMFLGFDTSLSGFLSFS